MEVLVRSMRVCLTSEGEQAVVTAVISLLALDIFLDSGAALQARAHTLLCIRHTLLVCMCMSKAVFLLLRL